jgi:hypothetical protein
MYAANLLFKLKLELHQWDPVNGGSVRSASVVEGAEDEGSVAFSSSLSFITLPSCQWGALLQLDRDQARWKGRESKNSGRGGRLVLLLPNWA